VGHEVVAAVLTRRQRPLAAVLDAMAPVRRRQAVHTACLLVGFADDAIAAGTTNPIAV
jgi:hypothetical protein